MERQVTHSSIEERVYSFIDPERTRTEEDVREELDYILYTACDMNPRPNNGHRSGWPYHIRVQEWVKMASKGYTCIGGTPNWRQLKCSSCAYSVPQSLTCNQDWPTIHSIYKHVKKDDKECPIAKQEISAYKARLNINDDSLDITLSIMHAKHLDGHCSDCA